MKQILQKLKHPTVIISVILQIAALLILMGVKIDENMVMTIIGVLISILASLGIISKSDMQTAEAALTEAEAEVGLKPEAPPVTEAESEPESEKTT